ncbi:MAG: bile acid:sodium symporter family protein [Erysipelotrichia bacterium]|nr:bile acid:sodium symporter family protein [Erysipelotrichia bacterium]
MRPFGERLYTYLNSHMIFFTLAAMACGWLIGSSLNVFHDYVYLMFAYMTFVTALKTSWRDLGNIFRKPLPLISIVVLQHMLMPFVANLIGKYGFPDNPQLITGFILCVALPAGITSVIWTDIGKGDVALSLTSATIDTLLSPLVVTIVLLMFAGQQVDINYTAMISSLFKMIVIPSILGLTAHDLSKGSLYTSQIKYLGPLSFFCMCAVIMINTGTAQSTASSMTKDGPFLIAVVLGMVIFGFLSGWLLAKIFSFKKTVTTSCIFCAGIRNTSAGLVIALGHMPPEASIPILIAMIFQQPIAAIVHHILTRSQSDL